MPQYIPHPGSVLLQLPWTGLTLPSKTLFHLTIIGKKAYQKMILSHWIFFIRTLKKTWEINKFDSFFLSFSCWLLTMGGGGGGRELDTTPTWAVALVTLVIIVISIILEKTIHKTSHVFLKLISSSWFLFCFLEVL